MGAVSFAKTQLLSGTARGRIGYAVDIWLFYATGGLAWSYHQQSLTQVSIGNNEAPYKWRLGWAAGAGVEEPIAPHWTARFEYLFTDYGRSSTAFFSGMPSIRSDFGLQELRFGLNYHFGGDADLGNPSVLSDWLPPDDKLGRNVRANVCLLRTG